MDKKGYFDADAFYAALDATREARSITWKTVAAEAGVSASTLTRIAQGRRPDVDSLAALAAWSGLEVDIFLRRVGAGGQKQAAPLAMISTYLRSDPHLSEESATALEEIIKATYRRLRKD